MTLSKLVSTMKCHRPARLCLLFVLLVSLRVQAAGLDEKAIDNIVSRALDAFEVPGMAVAVVRNGETIFQKGYGLRDVERNLPITPHTYFRIGSTSKAFTSAALAVLVQDGKLGWDDTVTEHLPEFGLYDARVTQAFSVRDLLTHRSGLWSGAGDYMLWPAPSGFSRAEVIANLRHFKPVTPFGSHYAYSNALYVAAGELIASVTGAPYETFVQTRLMEPLGIPCFAGEVPDAAMTDAAEPYVPYQGKPLRVDRNRLIGRPPVMAAAGGITCNAQGMARWMSALLAGGEGVLAPRQIAELWTGVTKMPVSAQERERDKTTHRAYALGWRIADILGFETVSHTGTLLGFQSQVMLVPAKGLGITVLTNGTNTRARAAVMQALLASWLAPDVSPRDWIVEYSAPVVAPRQMPKLPETVDLPLEAYTGTYADTWFGTINVSAREDGRLDLASTRMPAMAGEMFPRSGHEFLIKWYDPTVDADFLVRFEPGPDGTVTGLRLASTARSGGGMSDLEAMHFLRSRDSAK